MSEVTLRLLLDRSLEKLDGVQTLAPKEAMQVLEAFLKGAAADLAQVTFMISNGIPDEATSMRALDLGLTNVDEATVENFTGLDDAEGLRLMREFSKATFASAFLGCLSSLQIAAGSPRVSGGPS